MVLELPDGGTVEYESAFVPSAEATRLHDALVRELPWEEREIVLFGKRVKQPRLIAWAGDIGYRYSGQTLEPRPFGAELSKVLEAVRRRVGVTVNHVLVNRYRDGRDSMGFHADDEPELGSEPTVLAVSLGATRRFVLVPRRGRSPRFEIPLEHGSLLVMRGRCQAAYRHAIPKEPGVAGERLSLTFRRLLTEPRDS